jgi:hypothetical protein
MISNKLKMNQAKTELIVIGSKQQLKKTAIGSIQIGGATVKSVNSVRNLGAHFDTTMSMSTHIAKKCSMAFMHLYNLKKIRSILTRAATETLVHAFVSSQLDYANGLLYGLPQYQIAKFQRVLNCAARLIFQLPKYAHVTPLLKQLHWLPAQARVEYKILIITYKALHNMAPRYLTDLLVQRTSTYSLRSTNSGVLEIPSTRRTTMGDRAFSVCAPRLWNCLPAQIKNISTFLKFKQELKTFLFNRFYIN